MASALLHLAAAALGTIVVVSCIAGLIAAQDWFSRRFSDLAEWLGFRDPFDFWAAVIAGLVCVGVGWLVGFAAFREWGLL